MVQSRVVLGVCLLKARWLSSSSFEKKKKRENAISYPPRRLLWIKRAHSCGFFSPSTTSKKWIPVVGNYSTIIAYLQGLRIFPQQKAPPGLGCSEKSCPRTWLRQERFGALLDQFRARFYRTKRKIYVFFQSLRRIYSLPNSVFWTQLAFQAYFPGFLMIFEFDSISTSLIQLFTTL